MTALSLTKKIVREYDKIFFQTNSKRQTRASMKKVLHFEQRLRNLQIKEKEKEITKMLSEVKWLL